MAYGKFKMGRIKVDPREKNGFQKEPRRGQVGFEPMDLLTGKKRKPSGKRPIFGKKSDGRKTIMPVPRPRSR